GGGAAPEGEPCNPCQSAQSLCHRLRLSFHRLQISRYQVSPRMCGGKEIAKAAPHFTERHMRINKEGLHVFVRPYLAQGARDSKLAVGSFMGIGVGVSLEGPAVRQKFAQR